MAHLVEADLSNGAVIYLFVGAISLGEPPRRRQPWFRPVRVHSC